ncbi:Ubiquinone biosynthesis monooxygenase UbiB [uncultured Gammaproteobacteria bacterium]|jgi:ubiquinone biosynthesis protein|nr:Ubiquinone biosynthesis regulatory protein kinase UbiB [uncultured Gammaproteobacteria bacterium]CAC9468604.1 Ubiquinone biosynthesis regulatory protein kinase UbiB [uncultured Gammaproteobacteria bacterium]CAC9469694.1 Ubiquinone biosynthesis regulatory protein kinase UbiB [uncultured Gammaproteobacteria bacterium]VVH64424.1 Ubiquinone biosynthesis monooxygenase UbiB [uncultured Gammaproteobacteria bacterium]
MRNLARFIAIMRILMRYRIDALILSASFLKRFKPLLYLTPWHYIPRKKLTRGERIRLALEELGPIFIKFGQTLSTRRDLLPEDIGDELAKLQDSCPAFDSIQAKAMIEASLDGTTEQLFSKFELEPLASASIAQVHTAVTHQGDEVVVKIVRPDIEKIIKRDIALMYILAKFVSKYPMSKKVRPIEIVAEFEGIILNELNMLREAKNATQLRENFQGSDLLYVPKVHWDLCSEEVLTTERIYGTPVGDITQLKADGVDLKRLAEEGVIIFFTQVFKHNFFHADMHPGNIFVGPEGRYIGVDFGIMGVLDESDKDFLANMLLAFFNQDYHGVAKAYIESGWASTSTDVHAFERAIGRICEPMFEKSLEEISFGQVLMDLMAEAKNFDITVQPQLLLLDKTLLNIEGLGRQLYPQLDLWATAKPFLEDLVKEKYSMQSTIKKLQEKAPELLKEIPELPSLVLDALKQMNNISNIQNEQTKAIINQLKDNSNRQTSAIFSGALLILSGVLVVNYSLIAGGVSAVVALVFWMKSR